MRRNLFKIFRQGTSLFIAYTRIFERRGGVKTVARNGMERYVAEIDKIKRFQLYMDDVRYPASSTKKSNDKRVFVRYR